MADLSLSKASIRREKRRLRDSLSAQQLLQAQTALSKHTGLYTQLRNARRVLSYIPLGGEISPKSLEQQLVHAQIYQPRITHFSRGLMQIYPADGPKSCNRYGIWEPAAVGTPMPAQHLDAVLVPLVAFDRQGNRLGMGAGFYDRAMAFKLARPANRRPLLVGLAHHFQEVNSLQAQAWDVPLDAILTDRELITVSRS